MERKKILSVTIDDCEVQTFRSGGSGGQNQNKRDTGVRVIHHPSGARGEARDERSQWQNKKLAWKRMHQSPQFQLWLKRTLGQQMVVESQIRDVHVPDSEIQVEVRRQGRWTTVDPASLIGDSGS